MIFIVLISQVQPVLQDQGEVVSELGNVQQHCGGQNQLLSLRPHRHLQRRRLPMVGCLWMQNKLFIKTYFYHILNTFWMFFPVQATHEKLYAERKPAVSGYPVLQPASDRLFREQLRRWRQSFYRFAKAPQICSTAWAFHNPLLP